MNLRHIEIFHAVYVTRSVSGAARALNVSQPTVSKVLRHAESQLGFDLFHREKKKIFPTEKGELLFQKTQPIFENITELHNFAASLKSSRLGHLRLATTPAFALAVVPQSVRQFSSQNPDISIQVETLHAPEITKALADNLIDLGVVLEATAMPGLIKTSIGRARFVCVAPTEFGFPAGAVVLDDLKDYPLIRLSPKSPLGFVLDGRIQEIWGTNPSENIVVETYHLAKRLAATGAGVAIIDNVTAFSGQITGLTVHDIEDLNPISVDLLTRRQEPLVGYKANYIDLLKAEVDTFT